MLRQTDRLGAYQTTCMMSCTNCQVATSNIHHSNCVVKQTTLCLKLTQSVRTQPLSVLLSISSSGAIYTYFFQLECLYAALLVKHQPLMDNHFLQLLVVHVLMRNHLQECMQELQDPCHDRLVSKLFTDHEILWWLPLRVSPDKVPKMLAACIGIGVS